MQDTMASDNNQPHPSDSANMGAIEGQSVNLQASGLPETMASDNNQPNPSESVVPQDSGLPPAWEVRTSKSRNMPYYFHRETKESRWEPPADADVDKLKKYMAARYHTPASPPDASGQGEDKIRCSHLLVKHKYSRRPSSWREAEITRSKEEAIEILKGFLNRIQNEGESLGELAKSESDCSSARKKGDLGFFGRREMQKEFEDVAFDLQPGEISDIIETASGFHLIQRVQ